MLRATLRRLLHPASTMNSFKQQLQQAKHGKAAIFASAKNFLNDASQTVVSIDDPSDKDVRNVAVFLVAASSFNADATAPLIRQCTNWLASMDAASLDLMNAVNIGKSLQQMSWTNEVDLITLLDVVLFPCITTHLKEQDASSITPQTLISLLVLLQKVSTVSPAIKELSVALVHVVKHHAPLMGQKELTVLVNTGHQLNLQETSRWSEMLLKKVREAQERFLHSPTDHKASMEAQKRASSRAADIVLLVQLLQRDIPLRSELITAVLDKIPSVVSTAKVQDVMKLFQGLSRIHNFIDSDTLQKSMPSFEQTLKGLKKHISAADVSLLLPSLSRLKLKLSDELVLSLVETFIRNHERANLKNLTAILQQTAKYPDVVSQVQSSLSRICLQMVSQDAQQLTPEAAVQLLSAAASCIPQTVSDVVKRFQEHGILFKAGASTDVPVELTLKLMSALAAAVTTTMEEEEALALLRQSLLGSATANCSDENTATAHLVSTVRDLTKAASNDDGLSDGNNTQKLKKVLELLEPRMSELSTMYDIAIVCRAYRSMLKTGSNWSSLRDTLVTRLESPSEISGAFPLLGILGAIPMLLPVSTSTQVEKMSMNVAPAIKQVAPIMNNVELNTVIKTLATRLPKNPQGLKMLSIFGEEGAIEELVRHVGKVALDMDADHVCTTLSSLSKLKSAMGTKETTIEADENDEGIVDESFTVLDVATQKLGARFLTLDMREVSNENFTMFISACDDTNVLLQMLTEVRKRASDLNDVELTIVLSSLAKHNAWNKRSLRPVVEEAKLRAASGNMKTVASALTVIVPLVSADRYYPGPNYECSSREQVLSEGMTDLLPFFLRRLHVLLERIANGEEAAEEDNVALWMASRALLSFKYPPQPATNRTLEFLLRNKSTSLNPSQVSLLLQSAAARSSQINLSWENVLPMWLPKCRLHESDTSQFIGGLSMVASVQPAQIAAACTPSELLAKCMAVAPSLSTTQLTLLLKALTTLSLDESSGIREVGALDRLVEQVLQRNTVMLTVRHAMYKEHLTSRSSVTRAFNLVEALLEAGQVDVAPSVKKLLTSVGDKIIQNVKKMGVQERMFGDHAATTLTMLITVEEEEDMLTDIAVSMAQSAKGVSFPQSINFLRAVDGRSEFAFVSESFVKACITTMRREPETSFIQRCTSVVEGTRHPATWIKKYPELEAVVTAKLKRL